MVLTKFCSCRTLYFLPKSHWEAIICLWGLSRDLTKLSKISRFLDFETTAPRNPSKSMISRWFSRSRKFGLKHFPGWEMVLGGPSRPNKTFRSIFWSAHVFLDPQFFRSQSRKIMDFQLFLEISMFFRIFRREGNGIESRSGNGYNKILLLPNPLFNP